jgi:phenylacetate-CoA ligase
MHFSLIYTLWYSYNFKKKFKQSFWKLNRLLSESQYWNKDKMKEYHDAKLAELQNISASTIFYSQNYKKSRLQKLTTDNLTELKPLTKEIIKKNPEILYNLAVNDYNVHSTSGSSGDPVKVRVSFNAEAYRRAGRMRYYEWWGIKPSDRNVLIWGRSIHINRDYSFLGRIKKLLNKRNLNISVFDLSSESFPSLFKTITRFKPRFFRGYTSAIEQFADLCIDIKVNLKNLKLKGVIVTSEVLFEDQRKKIESVFGCPVINEYGAADGGLIAFECPHGNMHIFEEAILVNTTFDKDILLTDLHNYAMPLINYELGDRVHIAEGKQCRCGRSLKIIDKIEGRQGDYIHKSNGQWLSQYFFYYLFKDLDNEGFPDNIIKYKVIQIDNIFNLYYIKGSSFSEEVISHIRKKMYKKIGDKIEVNFIPVTIIEREKSGKIRFFHRIENKS